MIEDIIVGVMIVVVLAAAIFGWWFENGASNANGEAADKCSKSNNISQKDEK